MYSNCDDYPLVPEQFAIKDANRHETSRNVWSYSMAVLNYQNVHTLVYLSNKNISNDLTGDIVVCWFNNIEAWCSGAVRSVVPKCEIRHTN